jgi:hypothetical protein
MSDNENRRDYERWTDLVDRQAAGEQLSSEQLDFCERFGSQHPSCVREMEFLQELALLDVPPSPESGALVDAVLARISAEGMTDRSAGRSGNERTAGSNRKRATHTRRLIWLGSAAAAAAAFALGFVFVPRVPVSKRVAVAVPTASTRIELVYAAGEVKVDGVPVRGSSVLLGAGSAISVGRGSACVAMDPGIDMCAGENTAFRLSDVRSAWRRIDLDSGKLAVQLIPQPEGFHLSIVADGVWSTAVGTAFTVERSATEGVATTVMQGKVRVGNDHRHEQIVTAHQRAHMNDGASTLSGVSRSDESPEWALLGPAKLWTDPVSATLEVRGLPPSAAIWLDGQSVGPAPLSTLIPAGSHRLQALDGARTIGTREFVAEVGQLTVLSFDAPVPDRTPAPTVAPQAAHATRAITEAPTVEAPTAAPMSAATMLGEARRLMRAGQFRETAAQYEALRVAYPTSPEAQAVLVSLAELQIDRFEQPSAALLNVARYLSGENTALAEEALKVRIRALRMLGDRSQEAEAIDEFLIAHPRSFQSAGLARRLAEIRTTR